MDIPHDIYMTHTLQFQESNKKSGGGEDSKIHFPGKYAHDSYTTF